MVAKNGETTEMPRITRKVEDPNIVLVDFGRFLNARVKSWMILNECPSGGSVGSRWDVAGLSLRLEWSSVLFVTLRK